MTTQTKQATPFQIGDTVQITHSGLQGTVYDATQSHTYLRFKDGTTGTFVHSYLSAVPAKPTTAKTNKQVAFDFFFANAGFSYDPKRESETVGRARCARKLAQAEATASARGWRFVWEDDWDIGNHKEFYGDDSAYSESEPNTCESCACYSADGSDILASLGCIDDATPEYRRVVEAELALEALGR